MTEIVSLSLGKIFPNVTIALKKILTLQCQYKKEKCPEIHSETRKTEWAFNFNVKYQ